MAISRDRVGELYAFGSCAIWALFPVMLHESFNPFAPVFTAGFSTLAAAVFFLVILLFKGNIKELLDRRAWLPIIYASLLIGVMFYGLVFTGLKHTSPGNVSLLCLLEIFVSFLFLGRKEKSSRRQFLGALLMASGAVYLLCPGRLEINKGDIFVISACFFAPYGNYFVKQAGRYVGSAAIMFLRSLIGGLVLVVFGIFTEGRPSLGQIQSGFCYIFLSGVLLMGVSKILWAEGIFRTSIPKATAFAALSPAITLIASVIVLGLDPTTNQLISLFPMCVGLLITVSGAKSVNIEV